MGFPSQPQPARPRWRRMGLSLLGVRGVQRGEWEKLKGEEGGRGRKGERRHGQREKWRRGDIIIHKGIKRV